MKSSFALFVMASAVLLSACTQEQQNQISRSVQNWTGTDGVLEFYAGEKLTRRFIGIDKLTTATATSAGDRTARSYRYGYGVFDANLNMVADPGEKKVYFEISDYASNYIFFENPN